MTDEQQSSLGDDNPPSAQSGEPAAATGAIVAGSTILINGLIMFGITTFTPDQKAYLLAAVAFLAPAIAGAWIRFKVWSPKTVDQLVQRFQGRIHEAHRETERARAEAAAARSATSAVQEAIPMAIQGLATHLAQQTLTAPPPPADDPQEPAERPHGLDPILPPSPRVYGPLGAAPGGEETRSLPADFRWEERDEMAGPMTDPEGARYTPRPRDHRSDRPRQDVPRGYGGRRHRRED